MVGLNLMNTIIDGEIHLLNYWRKTAGGDLINIENENELITLFQILALEVYPYFLIKNKKRHIFSIPPISFLHKSGEELKKLILSDNKLKNLFNIIGTNDDQTLCSYISSTGSASQTQLSLFIEKTIFNSYCLMILNNQDDINDYLVSVKYTVELLQEIAINKKCQVPVQIGFSNVSFEQSSLLKVPQGELSSFNKKILKILPDELKPLQIENIDSAFVFKSNYEYNFKFKENHEDFSWPKEMSSSKEKLNKYCEDITLAINLSCRRTPAISLNRKWTLIFDPLHYGPVLTWTPNSPLSSNFYNSTQEDLKVIKEWCEIIHTTNDAKIRLAIRKTISAISNRINPIDSFIDGIIAWENLFGSNAELSFRISSAITCLLEKDKTKRNTLYKQLKDTYNTRSKIVHGVKEITPNEAIKYRDLTIKISLDCIAELYKNNHKLINEKDRSLKILLGN